MAKYTIKNNQSSDIDYINLKYYINKRTNQTPVELICSGHNIPQKPSQDGTFSYQPNHGCIGSFFETWKNEDGSIATASIGICQDETHHNQSPEHFNIYLAVFDKFNNRIDKQADVEDSKKLKNHFINNPDLELKKIDEQPQTILVNWQSFKNAILLSDKSNNSEIDLNSQNQ